MKKLLVSGLVLGLACFAFAKGSSVTLKKAETLQTAGDVVQSTAGSNLFWAEQEIADLKAQNLPVPAYLYREVREYYGLPEFDLPLGRQGGEDVNSATPITLPHNSAGTTIGFVDDYDEACPYTGSTAPDVVYSFAPGADMVVDITLCNGSDYDTKLFVYENSATPGAPYACNDDSCPGYVSELPDLFLTGGNTYFIVVDGYYGSSGNYVLDVTEDVFIPPPANDTCENAEFISGPYPVTVSGNFSGATIDCPGLLNWNAVWYEVDLPYAVQTVTVDWCSDVEPWDNYGIILMNDCLCDDYIPGSYGWDCGNGNLVLSFAGIAGPGSILFPHYVQDYDLMTEDFVFNINVEEFATNPEGDSCGDPIVIPGLPYNFAGTTADNTDTYGNASPDEWFEFLGCEGDFRITLCDGVTSYDSYIRLLAGDCATEIASNDDFCGLQSEMNVTLTAGGNYYICVEGYSSGSGAFTLDVTGPDCTPPGDLCATPFVAPAIPYMFSGTTADNTDSYGNSSPDEWHRFTLDEDATVCRVTLCDGATSYDSYIRLMADDCATQIASNDDFCGLQSEMNLSLMAGTYVVCVEGYSSSSGAYDLLIEADFVPPPLGDACDNPIIVDSLPYSTQNTTADNNDTYGNSSPDEWYEFTVVNPGDYLIELCDAFTDYDTYLRLFTECYTQIAYDDDGPYGECPESPAPYTPSEIFMPLDAGTYIVCVEGYSSNSGNYDLFIGQIIITDVDVPETTYLARNYPNPFNPSTTIEFGLSEAGVVELAVYDVTGRLVQTLQNGLMTAGNHTMEWAPAADLASGIYFLRMTTADFSQVQKMTFVK
ncbi:MAG: T9SS type A sorting domain-containing protein [Candidatus Delongbacteria bacterium]|nr:T9SS type A sorting domain-containing protein [Candidatus Delongbacteria bacterium]